MQMRNFSVKRYNEKIYHLLAINHSKIIELGSIWFNLNTTVELGGACSDPGDVKCCEATDCALCNEEQHATFAPEWTDDVLLVAAHHFGEYEISKMPPCTMSLAY